MCAAFSPLQTYPAKKDSLFHRGHPGLQYAALAGPDGSAFLFLPALCPFCLNFHQREARCFSAGKDGYFVSEGFSRQLPLATAAHNRLTRLQQGRSGASLVSFPICLQYRTQRFTGRVVGLCPKTRLPLPLKGEGLGIIFLGLLGLPCSFTTGSRWPNRAGLGLWWCRFPTLSPKLHTGPHRGEFGFTAFSWCALGLAKLPNPAPACIPLLPGWVGSCNANSRSAPSLPWFLLL